MLKSYETEVQQVGTDCKAELELVRKEKETLVQRVQELENELKKVRMQTEETMETDTETDPEMEAAANYKVLRFAGPGNPIDITKSDHAKNLRLLRKDNEELRKQLETVLGGKEMAHGNIGVQYELAQLGERLKNEQTKRERTEKAFQAKAKKFRNTVYSLLGYRIDLKPENLCRLTSIYAENDDDYLVFEVTDGGRHLEMKETPFSAGLSELVETYLRKHNTVPAFLAALTLDLVRNHTLLQL
jgi:mitotic spindle assembly checkpoint protein MAD1